jgi:hypothetical protein
MIPVDLYAFNQKIGSGFVEGDRVTGFTPHPGGPKLETPPIQIVVTSKVHSGQAWTSKVLVTIEEPFRLQAPCPFK